MAYNDSTTTTTTTTTITTKKSKLNPKGIRVELLLSPLAGQDLCFVCVCESVRARGQGQAFVSIIQSRAIPGGPACAIRLWRRPARPRGGRALAPSGHHDHDHDDDGRHHHDRRRRHHPSREGAAAERRRLARKRNTGPIARCSSFALLSGSRIWNI
jgi:hypothetical protein